MLPFLEPKKIVSVISARRGKADVKVNPERESPDSELDHGLKAAAEDLLRGIEAKSPIEIAKAWKAAHAILESSEPEEGGTDMDEGA